MSAVSEMMLATVSKVDDICVALPNILDNRGATLPGATALPPGRLPLWIALMEPHPLHDGGEGGNRAPDARRRFGRAEAGRQISGHLAPSGPGGRAGATRGARRPLYAASCRST